MKSLLIPLMYFCLQTWLGTAEALRNVTLDMMPNAFDDQYIGCTEEMEGIARALLEPEMSNSSRLDEVWKKANETWKNVKRNIPLPEGFQDEYGIAIVAYTDNTTYGNITFSTEFNQAVREYGTSRDDYKSKFPFKAFHYYLTRALQLLRRRCDVMYKTTVYRGVRNITFQHSGSAPIRFGQFTSSSVNKEVAMNYGTDTFFTIHTCLGVDIRNFSYNPVEEEVLIPVHEKFCVSKEKKEGHNHYVLRSTNWTCSHFNCGYLDFEYRAEQDNYCAGGGNLFARGGGPFPGWMIPLLFGGSIILIHAAALKLSTGF